jgi:hypothetical protein
MSKPGLYKERSSGVFISEDISCMGRQKIFTDPLRRHRRKCKQVLKLASTGMIGDPLTFTKDHWKALYIEAPG